LMLTREVKLHTGMIVGASDRAMTATIREETLEDELVALESGIEGLRAHRTIMMRRVTKIGDLDDPQPAVLRKLTRTDWELIERSLQKLDLELAEAAGLVERGGGPDAGRDEPGRAAPGDA
ncbi:MAG: hypothetical protein AAF409_20475, partial [Pseudomonadota bacterium]